MGEVEQVINAYEARANSSAVSKVDVLMDLERLDDPRIVPFFMQALIGRPRTCRISSGTMTRVVSSSPGSVRGLLRGRLLRVDVVSDLLGVRMEPSQMERVLANLLQNAIKYAPSAAIGISARIEPDHRKRRYLRTEAGVGYCMPSPETTAGVRAASARHPKGEAL